MLPLKFLDRLEAEARPRLVRHEVEGRASVSSDNYRLAPFYFASERGQAVLCVADRYGLHRWIMWLQIATVNRDHGFDDRWQAALHKSVSAPKHRQNWQHQRAAEKGRERFGDTKLAGGCRAGTCRM